MTNEAKCPFSGGARMALAGTPGNAAWWPDQLNLKILHQHSEKSDPMGGKFDYAREFKTLDLDGMSPREAIAALYRLKDKLA